MVESQAYMISTIDYFTLLGWLFLAMLVVICLAKPPFGAKPGAATAGGH
jgi:DHA2 family multidrug resistance protein